MASILFVTFEFSKGTFSGNGVYAVSQVRALVALGHRVTVVAACPEDAHDCEPSKYVEWIETSSEKWGVLNAACAWEEFSTAAGNTIIQLTAAANGVEAAPAKEYDVVLCVDWHAALAWRRACKASTSLAAVPWVFLSYRMFSRDQTAAPEILEAEQWAVQSARLTITLSRADQVYARSKGWLPESRPCPFLAPGIRADVAALPLPRDVCASSLTNATHPGGVVEAAPRGLLTSCVRLSPEKQPQHFVRTAAELSRSGALKRCGVTPLLLAATQGTFADSVVAEFQETVPEGRVERGFKGPEELASIFAQTRLNFHPCEYDAYGMTVIEAASQGAPSVMHSGGDVGAASVLAPERQESFAVNVDADDCSVAEAVEHILSDPVQWACVAARAAAAARAYDEAANARALMEHIQAHVLCATASEPK